jgi:hypothetical protein
LGMTLTPTSMPYFDANSLVRMPVCVVAETWATVPVGNCTGTPPSNNSGCVRVTSELLILADPVMIRD